MAVRRQNTTKYWTSPNSSPQRRAAPQSANGAANSLAVEHPSAERLAFCVLEAETIVKQAQESQSQISSTTDRGGPHPGRDSSLVWPIRDWPGRRSQDDRHSLQARASSKRRRRNKLTSKKCFYSILAVLPSQPMSLPPGQAAP